MTKTQNPTANSASLSLHACLCLERQWIYGEPEGKRTLPRCPWEQANQGTIHCHKQNAAIQGWNSSKRSRLWHFHSFCFSGSKHLTKTLVLELGVFHVVGCPRGCRQHASALQVYEDLGILCFGHTQHKHRLGDFFPLWNHPRIVWSIFRLLRCFSFSLSSFS